ncbi:MAG: hypothetical protein A2070_10415 [Bdellovibrionales bacterium GWC1_52_8]|nr:MAG: hypothetical protein A2Z97_05175 [Bdellovibrionales bacterium GWB1_52_6]OFZ04582.1 MAG: hypothetical protein A2X97_13250 [Bdellovibrionales bacterium GWA1_52_35]OFZ42959.1 MAG: hypothetical protein A2070_10415 [Bdellovibrionales bacterium GWC1_52_8]
MQAGGGVFRAFAIVIFFAIAGCSYPKGDSPGGTPPAPASNPGRERTDALIYSGPGSWGLEVETLSSILYEHGATYQQVSGQELDSFSLEQITKFRLLIFPGGDAWTLTRNLRGSTRNRLRIAVREHGLSYLGFCAGAWAAITPDPVVDDQSYGFGIVTGPIQEQSYLQRQGREYALSLAQFPDGRSRELLWFGGPVTPAIPGGVIARYPDGKPAITQLRAGRGFVLLSGFHPAITREILQELGLNKLEAVAPAFAWQMIQAGLSQRDLPAFP